MKDFFVEYKTIFNNGKLISYVIHVYQMPQWELGQFVDKDYRVVVRISVNQELNKMRSLLDVYTELKNRALIEDDVFAVHYWQMRINEIHSLSNKV